ncbi:MAG: DUF2071 domain-containing protein [Leptospiraceae bacterium]|nr:DUF2071 domain-containing protein [Leptospiraceae bacterium]
MDFRQILDSRIQDKKQNPNLLDVETYLEHFALINYALPKERLLAYIPQDRFEISEYLINGEKMALMSAVPFLDIDFHFKKIFPFLKFQFPQTNYRVYIKDKKTNESAVWFFGTTLGSYYVYLPRLGFNIPWHYAKYKVNCEYNSEEKKYNHFKVNSHSKWASSEIDLIDTGVSISTYDGFSSYEEMKLILTHPVKGYFYRNDSKLGTYSIWHEEMSLTSALPRKLYFSLYEKLGLLSREEMSKPLSVFLCPNILFEVYLPPKLV